MFTYREEEIIKNKKKKKNRERKQKSCIIRHFMHCSGDVKVNIVVHLYLPIIKLFLIGFQLHSSKFFKRLMGVPRDFSASALFVSLNVCNFVTLSHKLVYSFLNRIRSSSNTLIYTLFNSVHFKKCKLKKQWDKVLLIWDEHYDNEVSSGLVGLVATKSHACCLLGGTG